MEHAETLPPPMREVSRESTSSPDNTCKTDKQHRFSQGLDPPSSLAAPLPYHLAPSSHQGRHQKPLGTSHFPLRHLPLGFFVSSDLYLAILPSSISFFLSLRE